MVMLELHQSIADLLGIEVSEVSRLCTRGRDRIIASGGVPRRGQEPPQTDAEKEVETLICEGKSPRDTYPLLTNEEARYCLIMMLVASAFQCHHET